MPKVKNSGYTEKFRTEVLDSSMKAFKTMLEDDKNGVKPLYRDRQWNKEERALKKSQRKNSWWNSKWSKIQYKNVLFVTPTPGGVLLKQLQMREAELNKNSNDRTKMVEKGGLKIKNILCSKNPFKKTNCEQKMCPLCFNSEFVVVSDEEPKVSCNTNNVGYKWQCVTCQENNVVKVYEGETARSARLRGAEHLS